jgi:hypothetical protein
MSSWDFLVAKADLRQTRVAPADPPPLAEGQARLAIERFALTANNITYAVFGEQMRYWDFFPGPEGWGRIPVWGHARVEASTHPDLAVGQRFYGYYPMSTHLTVTPRKTRAGFADLAAHRADLPPVYNQYQAVGAASPAEDYQALLRPLFITGFLIEDFLDENALFGARSVVLTSASSKTAISLAFQLRQRGQARVVGLTSARNAAFVEGLGYYDQVVTYDAVIDRADRGTGGAGRLRGGRAVAAGRARAVRRRPGLFLRGRRHPLGGRAQRRPLAGAEAGVLLRPRPHPQARRRLGAGRAGPAPRRRLGPLRRRRAALAAGDRGRGTRGHGQGLCGRGRRRGRAGRGPCAGARAIVSNGRHPPLHEQGYPLRSKAVVIPDERAARRSGTGA